MSPAKFGYAESIPGSPEDDPDKCQALLAEAGHLGGKGLPEIEYLVFVGLYPEIEGTPRTDRRATAGTGFPGSSCMVMEVAAWLEKIFDKGPTAPQLADTGWLMGSPEPNLVLRPMWHSSGGLFTNITSPETDALIDKQQNIVNPDERRTSIQTELLPALAGQGVAADARPG